MASTSTSAVTLHALSAGHLTLPERFFITPLQDPSAQHTVPSLSFLIQHTSPTTKQTTRILFDLGIRRVLENYSPQIYKHAMTRAPLSGSPDAISSLAAGGLGAEDIDIVMFSHLHWDHIGTPSDFPLSTYVIGPGAKDLIYGGEKKKQSVGKGGHSNFEEGLLPQDRLVELPPEDHPILDVSEKEEVHKNSNQWQPLFTRPWAPTAGFPHTMDIFGDGSVYIVSAPGHLPGHINLLVCLDTGKYVYLAGDACHDRRLLTGEKEIATWTDETYPGSVCCIHTDKAAAQETLKRIREVMKGTTELGEVEVVFAHDGAWEEEARAAGRFFPGKF